MVVSDELAASKGMKVNIPLVGNRLDSSQLAEWGRHAALTVDLDCLKSEQWEKCSLCESGVHYRD